MVQYLSLSCMYMTNFTNDVHGSHKLCLEMDIANIDFA